MTRVDRQSIGLLRRNADVSAYTYDRDAQDIGIVHFGIGAFHRAHQAWYTDRAMGAGERNWAIAGVSLRSPSAKAQLCPQDGLYTVTERSGTGSSTVLIGAVREVLVASSDAAEIVARIAGSACRIISFTVTEKGYCRAADGSLDRELAETGSFYPYLIEALARRRAAGLPGVTLLSCDNLADNGKQLERLVADYCAHRDPDLHAWIARHCTFPSTMVDRIVPATTELDLGALQGTLGGLRDEGAVFTEPFSQWVIEDRFAVGRPGWDKMGAELVFDVAPYETAKLRLLNGAHSALAYLGLLAGHEFVHQAVADPVLRPLAEQLMRQEALPSIEAAPGQDLDAYADALLARFANSALNHRLAQIAIDGSQKIPQRWLETLAFHAREGRTCPAILSGLAAWLLHIRGDNGIVEDPRASEFRDLWARAGRRGIVQALFGPNGTLSSAWQPSAAEQAALEDRLAGPAGSKT